MTQPRSLIVLLLCHEDCRHLSRSHGCDVWQYALQCYTHNGCNPAHNVFCCGSTWRLATTTISSALRSLQTTINYFKRHFKFCVAFWLFGAILCQLRSGSFCQQESKKPQTASRAMSPNIAPSNLESHVRPELDLSDRDKMFMTFPDSFR